MKNTIKVLGIIALAAVIGFSFITCDNDTTTNDPPKSNTSPPLTGTVSISGIAEVGQTLTAVTTSLGGSGTISYQWKRSDGTAIGTNSDTYTVLNADVGFTITVTVTRAGSSGSVTSAPTAAVTSSLNDVPIKAKIADAENYKMQVEVNTDAANVAQGAFWVTQDVMTAFENAISAAENTLASAANQAALDTAVTTLQTAITTFTLARQLGSKTSGFTSQQATELVNEAKADKEGIKTSANGNDVSPLEYWVNSSALAAFNSAISALESASGSAIDAAYIALVAARSTFAAAKQHGTPTDKSALNNAITAANTAKNNVQTAADKEEVASGLSWATAAQFNALNTAIDAATAVKNNDNATKNEVDTAVSNLTNATTVFNTAKTNNGLGILKGSYAATASNPYVKLTSPIPYKVVNLPGETGDLLRVINPEGWAVVFCDISSYKNKRVKITFSADVKRVGAAGDLFWQINNSNNPVIGTPISNAAINTWHTMNVTWTGTPNDNDPKIYLSTYQNSSSTTTYYIRNFTITIEEETVKGSYAATAGNPYLNLTSPIAYQIVNLPSEGDLLKVVNPAGWAVVFCDISFYKNKNVTIILSAEVKRVGDAGNLFWQINNNDNPPIGTPINNAAVDTWHTMNVTWTGTPNDSDPKIYLSTYDNNSSTTTYYIRNFTITVGGETIKGSYAAGAGNPYVTDLTSPIAYQIVNLPSESGDLLKVVNTPEWAVVFCDISSYKNKNVTITFSVEVKRVGAAGNLFWQINNNDNPPIGTTINNAAVNTWHTMNVTWTGTPNDSDPKIYLSTYSNSSSTTTYYIRNFTIQVVQ